MIGNSITERIGIHRVALCFLEKFGWLEREQYVADHGIDTQIEIVDDGNPTGLLYCIQVKTGKSYIKKSKDCITFYPEKRHVDYWLNHSLPVILVICDLDSDAKYWNFITQQTVKRTKRHWKIEIPYENQLDDVKSIDKIRNFYFSNDNFTILESGIDNSHVSSRRISMKIVLKQKTPNIIIERQLPNLINGLKQSDYYRSEIVKSRHEGKLADCVWIWFYRNYEQYRNGLPFCTASWNHPDSESPTELPQYDKEINGIYIKYSSSELSDDLINRRLSKGVYLSIVDTFLSETNLIYASVTNSYTAYQQDGNMSSLKHNILKYRSHLEGLLTEEYHQNYAPLECADLDQIIQNMYSALGNIFIVVDDKTRDDKNVVNCIRMYLKNYMESIEPSKYERKKAI